jgi:hypothetical protein
MSIATSHREIALHLAGVRRAGWTVFLSILVLAPLFVFPFPGLQDYPNHLARAFILLHPSDPILERLYSIQWTTLPNLGWDIWAMGVGRIVSLEWTGKLFLVLSSVSMLAGCCVLSRALQGKWTFAPLLAVPFLFNTGFTKGFLNFNLGVGLALLGFACWVSIDKKHWHWRLLAATLVSTMLYIIHLYGWAFYGILIFGYELQDMLRTKEPKSTWRFLLRLGRDGLQAVPALVMLSIAARSGGPEFNVQQFDAPYVRLGQLEHLIDVGDAAANGILLAIVAATVFVLFRRGWLSFRPDFALAIAIALTLFFVLPDKISGTHYVSWRILLMAVLAGIASLSTSEEADLRINQIMSVVALVTIVIVGAQLWSWRNSEIGRQNFLTLIRNVPDGSAIFCVHNSVTVRQLARYAIGLYHVGSYAVIAKHALVQSMFVLPGQQPLRFRDPALQSAAANGATLLTDFIETAERTGLDVRADLLRFDYVVVHGPDDGSELRLLPAQDLVPLDRIADFRLYRVIGNNSHHAVAPQRPAGE